MCDKAVDNYAYALEFIPDCYKTQKMCNKAINTYPSPILFVPECYKTQEMCDKAVNTCCCFLFHSVPDQYKTQEMCDTVVSEDPFMLFNCPDRYKTHKKMCDGAVNDCLAVFKFIPDWFVTSKMLEKFHDALLANDDILFFDAEFSKVTFFAIEMGILGVDLDKTNIDDDNNFDENDPETIIHVRLLAWRNKFEKRTAYKRYK